MRQITRFQVWSISNVIQLSC